MLPTRLEIRNFIAYRQPDPVIFDGMHLACLTGPNGAGKSSLLDAITWALWGKARCASADDLIYQGQTETFVQLDFLQGETLYRVVRQHQKPKSARGQGRSLLDLFMWDDNLERWQPLSSPAVRETQQKIVELLRLNYETFVHSAFLQQGQADAFTVKTPAKRKEILAEILGLEQWQKYEETAKERLRQIDQELMTIAAVLDDIIQQEAEEPALRRDLEAAQAAHVDASLLREEAENRYQEVAGAQEQMNAANARLAQAEHRIKQRERDLRDIELDLDRHHQQLDRLAGIIAEQDTIQAGFAYLQAAREADQQLGEKLQVMSTIKDRLNDTDKRIQAARAELENQATAHRTRIEAAERSAAELGALHADLADVRAEVERLETMGTHRDELRETINALNEENAGLQAENKSLFTEMQAIKTRIETVEAAEAVCPLCGQPLGEDHKLALLEELQADGTQRGDTYRANESRRKSIGDLIKADRAEIAAIDVELERLLLLRERAGKLEALVEDSQTAADQLQVERSELAVIEEMLSAGEYAQELQAQRDSIQSEIDSLGYDSDAHTAARETLTVYAEYDNRQRDLDVALTQVPDIEISVQNLETRRQRWIDALVEEQQEAAAAQIEIDALKEKVDEARRREEDLRKRRTEERLALEQVTRVQQALNALEYARQRKASLEERRTRLSGEKSIYEELRAAFGKNGVPAMIIEAAIPELEEEANYLLTRMTDGRMHVRLDTQKEKKTGGVSETLEVLISDELGTRNYESYSGGEAFRVNFALRVALSQMLARRAGARLRTLFIDEGFGTQDDQGRQRLVEAINSVQDQFDLLLVITHIDELRDAFPVQIVVSKTPDGSRVMVR